MIILLHRSTELLDGAIILQDATNGMFSPLCMGFANLLPVLVQSVDEVEFFTYIEVSKRNSGVHSALRLEDGSTRVGETVKELKVLDLFSGCGGLALGFERAGYETVFAVDNDPAAVATFNTNLAAVAVCKNIEDVRSLPHADVVVGGPPCQGFSNLGAMDLRDPRNQLWEHYFRVLELVQPKAFLLENVPPFLTSPQGTAFRKHAELLGYHICAGVLNTADYGVPQTRKRTIIIGLKRAVPFFPQPTHGLNAPGLIRWQTVRDAFANLPLQQSADPHDWHFWRIPTPFTLDRIKTVPTGGNRWDLYHARPDLTPECWIRKTEGGTDLFGRLWWDRPSVTIRTEFYKPEKGRYLHPSEDRGITWREAMRIQTFPDDFKWMGKRTEVARQVGNAVPPLFAQAIAEHVSELLLHDAVWAQNSLLRLPEERQEYVYA